jgi:hypothetical protein
MKIIDYKQEDELKNVGLFLTIEEAIEFRNELNRLLEDPEALSHFHVHDRQGNSADMSCSIITKTKLKEIHKFNQVEQRILSGKKKH